MNDDRALAEETTYYVSLSGCGTAATTFTTAAPSNGTSTGWPVPFNSAKWGNRGWPFTLANVLDAKGTQYVDPLTGLKMNAFNNAQDFTWRWPGGGGGPLNCGSHGYANCIPFSYYASGSGWSNLSDPFPTTPSTVTATSSSSYLDLYPGAGGSSPWSSLFTPTNDLGVDIFASLSAGGSTALSMCLFTNPSASGTSACMGTPVSVTGITSTFGLVASASSDPDTPWPSSFPSALFSGWGSNVMIGQENQPTQSGCALSASSGVLTVDSSYQGNLGCAFNLAILNNAGNKIYVAGSSPTCTNNLCTSKPQPSDNAYVLHTVENVTVSTGTAYVALGWGVRIFPNVSSGTLTLGASYKLAGSEQPEQTGPGGPLCNPQTFAFAGTGPQTRLCEVQALNSSQGFLWTVETNGIARNLWAASMPSYSYFTTTQGFASADVPILNSFNWQAFQPSSDAYTRYEYVYTNANRGLSELYKLVYTGNGSESLNPWGYTLDPTNGGVGPVRVSPSDNFTWTTLTPAANSIVNQAVANFGYNSSFYGTGFSLSTPVGIAGTTAYFQNTYAGQNYGAWIGIADLTTTPATLTNLIHTMDGTGTNGHMRFGGLHNLSAYPSITPSPTAIVSNNLLYGGNSSVLYGGPFEFTPTAISRGGSWSTNTCLDWPISCSGTTCTGTGGACPGYETYDAACPSGNPYVFMGASGNQCVTFEIPSGGWCNLAPSSAETKNCPWNASYSQPFPIQVGDQFVWDRNGDGSGDVGDDEHFRVVSLSGTTMIAQRNAMWDYCGYNDTVNRPGNTNVDTASQLQHATGLKALAAPAYLSGCGAGEFVVTGLTQSGQNLQEIGRGLQGHGDLLAGETAGASVWASPFATTKQGPLATLFSLPPPPAIQSIATPTFAGASLSTGNGVIQSYPSSPGSVPWILDSNFFANSYSGGQLSTRTLTRTLGSVTLTGNLYFVQMLGFNSSCSPTPGCWYNQVKNFPVIAWAGRNNMLDVSGPSSATTLAAAPYGVCLTYNAGECASGTTVASVLGAGYAVVNVPWMFDQGYCVSEQQTYNSPCVEIGWPGAGQFRQSAWDRPENQGTRSRSLGWGFGGPGQPGPFTEAFPISTTQAYIPPSGPATPFGNTAWLAQLPSWTEDTNNRTVGGGITVQVPSGAGAYARVHFGYSRFSAGVPSNFYCSSRAESCNTNGSPYSFDSESSAGTSCSSGCTITVPAMAPNLVYWQIQVSSNGATWADWGGVQASAVQ